MGTRGMSAESEHSEKLAQHEQFELLKSVSRIEHIEQIISSIGERRLLPKRCLH